MKNNRMFLVAAVVGGLVLWSASSARATLTYTDVVLADNPQYYWTWNDGNNNGDNINHGSVGGVGNALSKVSGTLNTVASTSNAGGLSLGNAATFPGPNANQGWYNPTPTGGGDYTSFAVEFWINLSDVNQTSRYIVGANDGSAIIYGFSGNGFEFYNNGPRTGSGLGTIGDGFTSGTWYHLVMGYKQNAGPDVTTLIIDGGGASRIVRTTTNLDGFTYKQTRSYEFGQQYGAAGATDMTGLMDEYAVYDLSSLSQAQFDAQLINIADNFSAGVPEPASIVMLGLGGLVMFCYRHRRK